MIAYSSEEINSLIGRFEKQSLPKSEWTHEAHLVVAIWYCWNHDDKAAMDLVRDLITRHNVSVGTVNSDTDGYHETITKFWLWVARQYLNTHRNDDVYAATNSFISSEFSASKFPLRYYSSGLLFSIKARHSWITPDLHPLTELI
ncbi:MAG: hypothetical protein R2813_09680 [Flavobacteriales bacterium]